MEHRVDPSGWGQSAEGFSLWTITEPRVCVEAENYALAEERLLEAIRDRAGAIHAVLEFNPPPPKSQQEQKYTYPELYLICGDGGGVKWEITVSCKGDVWPLQGR